MSRRRRRRGNLVEGLLPVREQSPQQPAPGFRQELPPGAGGSLLRAQRPLVLGAQDAQLLYQRVGPEPGDIEAVP
ncbi:hypothetical protein [Streptomyces sp. 13-12-16]|uniref:hypothetical protein n=1 Tax=Streptomyces sp. 13-12-16 TaxID=1570823 RepID=UPI0015C449CF|nr:hypothetical protein [Streptomyces sp. 13-12-16]